MSGLAGGWCSSASHEQAEIVRDLVSGVSHRGSARRSVTPDPGLTISGVGPSLVDGAVGGWYESTDVVVTFDGYLTEREHLARQLGRPSGTPSAAIVAALMRERGPAGLSRLAGHFAFALWWAAERRLLLARDAMGLRPLFIAQHRGLWAWSSAAKPLARALARDR